jgi:hypothetical protein
VNICQNETAGIVRMEIEASRNPLKTLERVKGIEPSYSAWKAAALPLSYTRVRPINYHATPAASTTLDQPQPRLATLGPDRALTGGGFLPILGFPSTERR